MKVTEKDMADSIMAMIRAGKQLDLQTELFGEMTASDKLKTTAKFWYEQFKPMDISRERWQKATSIAVMLTKVDGLNVNKVTPALMKAALKQCEQEYVATQQAKNQAEKQEEPFEPQPASVGKYLCDWTFRRLRHGLPFNMPTDDRVKQVLAKIGLKTCENNALVKTFIADNEYCKQCQGQGTCYMNRQRTVLDIDEKGKCNIRYKECAV